MSIPFLLASVWIVVTAIGAMACRNLVHCALCLVGSLIGMAVIYLQSGAYFIGFAQMLVYVGAVSVLIVFAILLTKNSETPVESTVGRGWPYGLGIAAITLISMVSMVLASGAGKRELPAGKTLTVQPLGVSLMTEHVLALEVVALLLTSAMIGAAVLALPSVDLRSTEDKEKQ